MTGDVAFVSLIFDQPGLDLYSPAKAAESFDPPNRELMLITEFCADRRFDIIKGGLALHYACLRGNVEVLKLILTRCARFNLKDSRGWRPYKHCDVRSEEGKQTLQVYLDAKDEYLRVRALYTDSE